MPLPKKDLNETVMMRIEMGVLVMTQNCEPRSNSRLDIINVNKEALPAFLLALGELVKEATEALPTSTASKPSRRRKPLRKQARKAGTTGVPPRTRGTPASSAPVPKLGTVTSIQK